MHHWSKCPLEAVSWSFRVMVILPSEEFISHKWWISKGVLPKMALIQVAMRRGGGPSDKEKRP